MKYAAQIGADGRVTQVIALADTLDIVWCESALGGAWVLTRAPGDPDSKCADVGDIYDPVSGTFTTPPPQTP